MNTLLLSSVTFLLQLFLVVVTSLGCSWFPNTRTLWMAGNCAIGVVGAVMVRTLPLSNRWGRFAGTVLAPAYAANFPIMMSLLSGNFGGFTKKTTVNAIIFISYCAGNIVGPQLFFEKEAPTYNSAFLAIIICEAFALVMSLVLRVYLARENKKRERVLEAVETSSVDEAERDYMINLADKTDKEIPQFRYVY